MRVLLKFWYFTSQTTWCHISPALNMEAMNCSKTMVLLHQTTLPHIFCIMRVGQQVSSKYCYRVSQTMLQHSQVTYVKVMVPGSSDQTARRHVSEYHNLSSQRGENFRSLSILLDAHLMLQSKLHTCVNHLCQLPRGPRQYSWVP